MCLHDVIVSKWDILHQCCFGVLFLLTSQGDHAFVFTWLSKWDPSIFHFEAYIVFWPIPMMQEIGLNPRNWKTRSTSSICIGCSNNNTAANSGLSAWGFNHSPMCWFFMRMILLPSNLVESYAICNESYRAILLTLNHVNSFLKHPMTYNCPQRTTNHHAQELIYHCLLIVFPGKTKMSL